LTLVTAPYSKQITGNKLSSHIRTSTLPGYSLTHQNGLRQIALKQYLHNETRTFVIDTNIIPRP